MRFFYKISRIEHNKLIFIFDFDDLSRVGRLRANPSIFLYLLVMTVSFLSMQVKNFTGPLEILNLSNWTFIKIS